MLRQGYQLTLRVLAVWFSVTMLLGATWLGPPAWGADPLGSDPLGTAPSDPSDTGSSEDFSKGVFAPEAENDGGPTLLQGAVMGLGAFDAPEEITVSGRILVDANNKQRGLLEITTSMANGWHLYSTTQQGPPMKTTFDVRPSKDLRLAGSIKADRAPDVRMTDLYGDPMPLEEYSDSVVWRVPLEISAGVDPQSVSLQGTVKGQVCNDLRGCVPVGANNGGFQASVAEYVNLDEYLAALAPPSLAGPSRGGTSSAPPAPESAIAESDSDPSLASATAPFRWSELLAKMLSGFAGGLLLNLMPCVLPVIGLKVMSFAQQAGESRRDIVLLNTYFVIGIVAVFMILAALAAFFGWQWGDQFQKPSYGIALAIVLFVFALSFLGVWEVPIPGFVGSGGATKAASKEGPTGAVAKGVLTTLLATPCGAPFIMPTLAWAVTQPTAVIFATFASMGLGMGAPYLLFGMFPGLMRALPKPGAWMETFKQSMGFILLATVVWILYFLNNIDHGYVLPTVATMFAAWVACWWIGRIPVTASSARKGVGYAGAIAVGSLLGMMSFAMLGPNPAKWQDYSPATLASLRSAGQPVFVDFTAAWCLSCKVNERFALHNDKTEQYLRANGITVLVADKTDESPEIDRLLHELGNKGGVIPFYAIYPPGGGEPIVFNDIPLTANRLLQYFEQALGGDANEMVGTRSASEAPGVISMQ